MFDSFDEHNDELMDLLSSYNCFRVLKENNFKNIIVELSHQELIQKPKYIINCFGMAFRHHLLKKFPNDSNIYDFYEEEMPTHTKVLKKLFLDEMNERQKLVSDFLKGYIKSFDKIEFKLFLRFVVGSDNIPVEINVVFCKQTIRAPRSRVCINQEFIES